MRLIGRGGVARTSNPRPLRRPRVSVPPNSAARSRIPTSPCPPGASTARPALVGDHQLERLVAVAHGHGRGRAARVADDVRHRLLHDPERRRVERRRQRARGALDRDRDRHARLARAVEDLVEGREARAGARAPASSSRRSCSVRCISSIARRPRPAIRPSPRRPASPRRAERLRLHDDQRHVVADRVVQLAGDAQPLLGGGALGELLALALRRPRAAATTPTRTPPPSRTAPCSRSAARRRSVLPQQVVHGDRDGHAATAAAAARSDRAWRRSRTPAPSPAAASGSPAGRRPSTPATASRAAGCRRMTNPHALRLRWIL